MAAQLMAGSGDRLTKQLRDYSVRHVKISEDNMARTRRLVTDLVENKIMRYCNENSSLPILRLEYPGSVYERLKTEAADEVDVMVVLGTSKQEVQITRTDVRGYVQLTVSGNSPLRGYADCQGNVNPERLRNGWFYSLVYQAIGATSTSSPEKMVVRAHGPAIQLDIYARGTEQKLLSVDLVPSFCIDGNYYVAKPYKGANVANSHLLWRRSFSLKEKEMLQNMDRDHGCRHELLRIVKTIVKREATSLGKLTSYHLKTAFLHYNKDARDWRSPALGQRFLGFITALQAHLANGCLRHYWLSSVNLLEDIDPGVVRKMADRLKRILNSEKERNEILDN